MHRIGGIIKALFCKLNLIEKRLHIMFKSKLVSWSAVIVWMALIFFLSHQPATDSRELSSGITEFILAAVEKASPEAREHVDMLHHIVRKNAHFMIYLILGAMALNALKRSGVRGYKSSVFAIGICVLYAMSDELHQLFVPGRSGEIKDVLIDSSGSAFGIVIYALVGKLFTRKKRSEGWQDAVQEN